MNFEDLENYQETPISIFKNLEDNAPKEFFLERWLLNTINPQDEALKERVLEYRETYDKQIKKFLPACTISASFIERRSLDNIVQKNKLICIDVDRYSKSKKKKCNLCVDMLLVKEMFMSHPCTLFCGLSVGGDGVYAIIRIADENNLAKYFDYFKEKFARIGVNIDESCKDYTRLRIFSYDPDAYFNPKALIYTIPEVKEIPKPQRNSYISQSDADKVEKLIEVIEQTGMDITQSYEDWVKIAAALQDGFGDMGLSYFHRISSYNSDYDAKATDKKWRQCQSMNKIKLAALFYVASSYGVRY
jgi:hypothetical protein